MTIAHKSDCVDDDDEPADSSGAILLKELQGMKVYNNNFIQLPPGSFKIIVFVLCIFGIVVPLFIQIFILLQQSTVKDEALLTSHKILYEELEIKKEDVESLQRHLKELENIKIKALDSLLQLDEKRVTLLDQITQANKERDELREEARKMYKKVEKAKKELEFAQQSKVQKVIKNIVYVGVPQQRSINFRESISNSLAEEEKCHFQKCFDFSKCSILNEFAFHSYKPISRSVDSLHKTLISLEEHIINWQPACVVLIAIDLQQGAKVIHDYLNTLPSWRENHLHNHVIILYDDGGRQCELIKRLKLNRAILVVNTLCSSFRKGYDFLLPNFDRLISGHEEAVPLYPYKRKYTLFFGSQFFNSSTSNLIHEEYMVELNATEDVFIKTKCGKLFLNRKCISGWCRCDFPDGRRKFLHNTLFALIWVGSNNPSFFNEIIDCFHSGTIPVFVGSTGFLPFSDVIDWKLASVILPLQRLPELLLLLKSMPFNDIVSIKLQGQFLYHTYFSSETKLMKTMLTNLRNKIGLTPTEVQDIPAVFVNNGTTSEKTEITKLVFSSPQFVHNFSYIGKSQYSSWNKYPGALRLYPVTPWNEPAPSRIQFLEEGKDFYMPIGDGTGGDGVAFARSLGGDHPVEQFTILMLTYDREAILMEALQRLSGMKYLNQVVVVWNHPVDPPADLEWPDIGVRIEVIRAGKNSLNNRFIPYNIIKTEAILSVDDDIYLRHDEIELAFRVWRENRDRLVGFPGRHHSYNSTSKSFYYNSLHSCELSLVLTGGAFFHKYYSYIYTYDMNGKIREMVDEYMNCEDIAMNFLVAHITRKPPIKVTSRWTFRCPGCPVALSADAHHYDERNECMAYFEKLYGYNPLKRTQFRADSILFKTRLPSSMTKCFQFV